MDYRKPLFIAFTAAVASGCLQEWDSRASNGVSNAPTAGTGPSTVILDGDRPIDRPDETTVEDVCDQTGPQAMDILQTNCAPCHQAPNSMANFDFVTDIEQLTTKVSSNGMRFVVGGDPDNSRIYLRMLGQAPSVMPPDGVPQRPTISDQSVMRSWILNCVEDNAGSGGSSGSGGGGASGSGASGASGSGASGASGSGVSGASGASDGGAAGAGGA